MQIPSVLARRLILSRRFDILIDRMMSNMIPHIGVSRSSHPRRTPGGFDPRREGRVRQTAWTPEGGRTSPPLDHKGQRLRAMRSDGRAPRDNHSGNQARALLASIPGPGTSLS